MSGFGAHAEGSLGHGSGEANSPALQPNAAACARTFVEQREGREDKSSRPRPRWESENEKLLTVASRITWVVFCFLVWRGPTEATLKIEPHDDREVSKRNEIRFILF